jgi:glutamate-ammonia-ligase adenylyltransferase
VDVEFAVQMLQLRHAAEYPQVLVPGTLDALGALHAAGCLDSEERDYFSRSYRFLRSVESGLRLMNTTARHDLPEGEGERKKLAYLLGCSSDKQLMDDCRDYTQENRRRFLRLCDEAARG